ncbi:MAG: DOMON domain-containing protein, partial [Planctomycetota bacterium]
RGRRFYQFAVSIHGVTLDAGMATGLGWNPTWRQALEVRRDRYNVELAIPYEVFELEGRPAPGTSWGVNFTRNDYSSGHCEVTQAAPTYGPNSRSGLYLRFKFE